MIKGLSVVALAGWLVAGASIPAFAQAGADFSGVWQPRYHEDQPDRIPGPELTDYTGDLVPNPSHFATAFDHLGSAGYAATYYTYLWSQVISKDLWSVFNPENPFDPRPANRYRDLVLRPGGGRPSAQLVRGFLGRPFGFESWRRWLEGGEAAPTP